MRRLNPLPLLVLLPLLLVPAPARGQFGFKGGINLVDFFGDDVETVDKRPRLAGGVAFDIFSLGPLTLAPELYYAQKGAENFQSSLAEGEPAEISLAYVEIPALVKLGLPFGGRRFQPYLAAGPVFGWQLSCSVTADQAAAADNCDQLLGGQEQLEETLRDYEQGLMFGAGFAFDVIPGIGAITLDARYAQGLTRLTAGEDGPDIQNRALSVLLGYRFGLGGGGGGPGMLSP